MILVGPSQLNIFCDSVRGPNAEGVLRAIVPRLSPAQDFQCVMQLHFVPVETCLEDKQ